jgi:hypothetical protein
VWERVWFSWLTTQTRRKLLFFPWRDNPQWVRASSLSRVRDHIHSTFDRTPLDEWSPRCRDLYLPRHNIHTRQTSMTPAGLEPTFPAGEQPPTYDSDRAATVIASNESMASLICIIWATTIQHAVIFLWCSDSKGYLYWIIIPWRYK